MKTRSTIALFCALVALAVAVEPPCRPLFNGRNLSGWKIVGPSNLASVTINDGTMILRQRRNTAEHTFVASEERFGDFILELDVKDDPGFNTGILLRCADAPTEAKVRLNGYQVKIDPTPRAWTGGAKPTGSVRWSLQPAA